MDNGYWEVKDSEGKWHRIDAFQAASYRLDGVPVRFIKSN